MALRTLESARAKHQHEGRKVRFTWDGHDCTGILRRCEDHGMLGFHVYIDQIQGHPPTAGLQGFIDSYKLVSAARRINA